MSVAHARREELAADIAEFLGVGVRAVRNRLDQTHGKTRLRIAFGTKWPPPRVELARLTTSAALELGLSTDIAAVVDLTPRQVRGRLGRVEHGKTLIGTVFADEWPSEQDDEDDEDEHPEGPVDVDIGDLDVMTVADARRLDLTSAIADRTGIGLRRVRARLRAAHGNVLIGNLFAAEWPSDDKGDEERASSTETGRPGKAPPLSGGTLVGGRFRLLRSLGKGGQGEAFEARDQDLPERGLVVIKFASFDTAAHEFTIAMRFRHEHICQYFDTAFDHERNRRYLVLEHGGQSLAKYLESHGALTRTAAVTIVAQAATALDYAHSKKVIHHDVSPGNVLIDGRGHVRVTDFGIAVAGTMQVAKGGHTMVAKTMLGRHPFYAAPEMTTEEVVRGRADQYSLALVLCSLLEGFVFTKPYRPRSFQRLNAGQNAALHRALSRKPDDRFPTCVAFANALKAK